MGAPPQKNLFGITKRLTHRTLNGAITWSLACLVVHTTKWRQKMFSGQTWDNFLVVAGQVLSGPHLLFCGAPVMLVGLILQK